MQRDTRAAQRVALTQAAVRNREVKQPGVVSNVPVSWPLPGPG
jgi:hypothetical protein